MNVLETILVVLQALCSVVLIAVIMLQSGKEAGLSGALAGKAETYLSKNSNSSLDAMLASSTKWIALGWGLVTLLLSLV